MLHEIIFIVGYT